MDTIIDRVDSFVFSNKEIDAVCDVVENLLFREIFEAENTLLAIHCCEENDNEIDNVLHFENRLSPEVEQIAYAVGMQLFDQFYAEVFDYPVPHIMSNTVKVAGTQIFLSLMCIKLSCGYINMFVAADDATDIDSAHMSMFGLAVAVCKILARRDMSASTLAGILTGGEIEHLDKATQDIICEKIDRLLRNHL